MPIVYLNLDIAEQNLTNTRSTGHGDQAALDTLVDADAIAAETARCALLIRQASLDEAAESADPDAARFGELSAELSPALIEAAAVVARITATTGTDVSAVLTAEIIRNRDIVEYTHYNAQWALDNVTEMTRAKIDELTLLRDRAERDHAALSGLETR